MKLTKKIIAIALLGGILVSNINIETMANLSENQKINSNLKVADGTGEVDPLSIKKIDLDSSGNPTSAENIDINSSAKSISDENTYLESRSSSLPDGIYTLDYGDGWVKGRDASVIGTITIPAGTTGIFSKDYVATFSNSILVQTSISFTKDFVTATIKAGYGERWIEGTISEIYKTIPALEDKNLFTKVESVYARIDVIRVENGRIVDRAETFKPTAFAFKSLEFEDGENVNQSLLYSKDTHCILGDSGYDISSILDTNVNYEGYVHFKDTTVDSWMTKYYNVNSAVGIYFTVPKDGQYEIKEVLYPYNVAETIYAGVQKTLYKVDSVNPSKINRITITPYDELKTYSREQAEKYPGPGFSVELKAGEQYLIIFNEYKPYSFPQKSNYRYSMQIKQLF